jgi:hypothetical protein
MWTKTTLYRIAPIKRRATMVVGIVKKGSTLHREKTQKLAYPPNIKSSPWATFRNFVTPNTKERPSATNEYRAPTRMPKTKV